jgi:hypothetical protein
VSGTLLDVDPECTELHGVNMEFHLKLVRRVLLYLVLPIVVLIVGTSIYERINATSSIEYRVENVGKLFTCPQGLEDRVTLLFDGKPHKNIGMLRISLFNRTTHAYGDVPIQIRLPEGSATPLAKVLLYPSEQDSDHFAWDTPSASNLRFTARAMNNSWGVNPVVSFNLFFDAGNIPDVSLSTPKPGIVFVPFDDTKSFLFRYDSILPGLIITWLAIVVGLSLGKYAGAIGRNRLQAYSRVFVKLYEKEIENAKEIVVTSAKQVSGANITYAALVAHIATNRRIRNSANADHRALDYANEVLAKIREKTAKDADLAAAGSPP